MNLPPRPAGTPVTNDYVRDATAKIAADVVRMRAKSRRDFAPMGIVVARDGRATTTRLDGVTTKAWPAIFTALVSEIGADWVILVCETYMVSRPIETPRSSIPKNLADAPDRKEVLIVRLEGGGMEYTWHAEIHPDGTVDAPTESAVPWAGGRLTNLAPRHN